MTAWNCENGESVVVRPPTGSRRLAVSLSVAATDVHWTTVRLTFAEARRLARELEAAADQCDGQDLLPLQSPPVMRG